MQKIRRSWRSSFFEWHAPAASLACWLLLQALEQPSVTSADLDRGLVQHWLEVNEQLELPAGEAPNIGCSEFTIAAWIQHDSDSARLSGDILSQYDPESRRGFHLTLKCNTGVTSNQANWRHLQFGIDDDRQGVWTDCGRPGRSLLVFAMAAHAGKLYVGTCEPGADESGRVYCYAGPEDWIDCGPLDGSNSVTAMVEFDGNLYAATGRYRVAGSSLPESENRRPGGRVFRYVEGAADPSQRWIDCGQLPDTEAIGGLVCYRGRLYASSLYKPAGFFRYEGGRTWTRLPTPTGIEAPASPRPGLDSTEDQAAQEMPRRVVSMAVFDGYLYATSYDCGHVYRYDGQKWEDCGAVGDNTQTYAFANYRGILHVATWPSGRVYGFIAPGRWDDCGRLGEELEVMGMMVHNGRFLAGTLPLAQIYAYEGGTRWRLLEQLDRTPDIRYRRAWTMCEHAGQLFCSTLPSGRVFAYSQGKQVSWDSSLSSGWHHVVAVKSADRLSLWLDGRKVSETQPFEAAGYRLDSDAPWRLAHGMNGPFHGRICDLRVYLRTLEPTEIADLSRARPARRD